MGAEPISVTGAKLIAPKVIESVIGAVRGIWKYYNDPDLLHLPTVSQNAQIANLVAEQIRASEIDDADADAVSQCSRYLDSADGVALLRSMIAFRLSGRPISEEGPLRKLYETGIRLFGSMSKSEEAVLFRCLSAVSSLLVESAKSRVGPEVDEESMRASQTEVMQTYLHSIDAQLAEMNVGVSVTWQEVENFRSSYDLVLRGLARIQPPSLDGADTVPIDDLYVAPEITIGREEVGDTKIGLNELAEMRRVVLLGIPAAESQPRL